MFQLMDYYSASGMTMLFLVFFQTVSIGWIFGGKRFCGCIEEMIGTPPSWFFYVCWVYLAPAIMLVRVQEINFMKSCTNIFPLISRESSFFTWSSTPQLLTEMATNIQNGPKEWVYAFLWRRCCGFRYTLFTTSSRERAAWAR